MHASTATVRKYRPELGLNELLCRSFLHMFAQLIPRTSPFEKSLRQLQNRWLKVASRKPQYVSGRHMFLGILMEKMHTTNEGRRSRGQALVSSSDVMASHGKLWRRLSAEQQQGYGQMAKRMQAVLDQQGHQMERHLEHDIDALVEASPGDHAAHQ